MENFSFYLTFDPKDYYFNTDSKLILSKTIPLQLYLDNYEVALTEISSTEIFLNHRQFIRLNNLFAESCFEILGYTNLAIPLDMKETSETTIDNYINEKLMKQIYFAYNRLFYDYQKLSRCIKKQVLIIFDSDTNMCVISIDPTLRKDAPNIFNKIILNTDVYLFVTRSNLQSAINEYNRINDMKIDLIIYKSFKTTNENIYKKDYNQLTNEEYGLFKKEFDENKSKLTYDLNGINFIKNYDPI